MNPLDSKYCRACGAQLPGRTPQPQAVEDDVPPPLPSLPSSSRRRAALAGGLAAAALLLGGGVYLAFALTHHTKSPTGDRAAYRQGAASHHPSRSSGDTQPATSPPSSGSGKSTVAAAAAKNTTTGLLPEESESQEVQDIQQMLLQFHQAISTGNWQDAWNLLSVRKQQQSLREAGYNGWIKNQKTLGQWLDPSGLQVSIVGTDPTSGVATVDLTGMTWTRPGHSACAWSGITWVKYENGTWRYDPGYSTTPQRRAQWGPPAGTSSPAYSNWLHKTWSKMMGSQCVPPA